MTAAPKLATYEDLLALSEDVKAEVLAGELVVQPSALPEHSEAQFGLGELVVNDLFIPESTQSG